MKPAKPAEKSKVPKGMKIFFIVMFSILALLVSIIYLATVNTPPLTPAEQAARQYTRDSTDSMNQISRRYQHLLDLRSDWDNSLPTVVAAVKTKMHNPDSFKHVGTEIGQYKGGWIVLMRFRGTNAFNAVITQNARAFVDDEADVMTLEIEQ